MAVCVTDKDSLKKAVDSKENEIIVTGKLAKKLKTAKAMKKATPAALAVAGGAIAAAVPTVIATMASGPATGGVAYFIGVPAIAAEAATVSASLSVSTGVAVSIIILAATIGVGTLIALFREYDVEFGGDGKGGIRASFKKRK